MNTGNVFSIKPGTDSLNASYHRHDHCYTDGILPRRNSLFSTLLQENEFTELFLLSGFHQNSAVHFPKMY